MTAKTIPMTKTRHRLSIAVFAATAALLSACAGGSGSSGFLSEAAVIQSVLDETRCMDLDGLEICPASLPSATPTIAPPPATATAAPSETIPNPQDTATPEATFPNPPGTPTPAATAAPFASQTPSATASPSPPPSASPTATTIPGSGIDVLQSPTVSSDCGPLQGAGVCLVLQLRSRGFPPSSVFYLAVRAADSADGWQLTAVPGAVDAPGSGELDAVAPLPPNGNAGHDSDGVLQIVVLVFFDDPGPLPPSVHRLADSGADQAFALPPVSF